VVAEYIMRLSLIISYDLITIQDLDKKKKKKKRLILGLIIVANHQASVVPKTQKGV
jgi:hypothetical protein